MNPKRSPGMCLSCFAALAVLFAAAPAAAVHTDRIEKRAQQLAIPDPILDPAWPELAPAGEPAAIEPGSVETVPEHADQETAGQKKAHEGAVGKPADEEGAGEIEELPLEDEGDGFEPDPENW